MVDASEQVAPEDAGPPGVVVDTIAGPVVLRPGTRVVVRYRLNDGRANDALGVLESADGGRLTVRPDRHPGSDAVTIETARVLAAKQVPPRTPLRRPRTAG